MTTEYQTFRLKCLAAIRRGKSDVHIAHLHDGLNLKLHNTDEDANNFRSYGADQNSTRPICTIYFYEQILSLKEGVEVDRFHDVFTDTLRKRKRISFVEN